MVGLSIVLDPFEKSEETKDSPHVINKATIMIKSRPLSPPCGWISPVTGFLERCFLCKRKLLAGKDIYMYKGDRAFCSVECRCKQILMAEKEIKSNNKAGFERDNCSVAAIKGAKSNSSSSSSSSKQKQKGTNNKK